MPRKSTPVIALLLCILFAVAHAEAGDHGTSTRSVSIRSVAATETKVQSTGSLGLAKILRLRFLHTLQLLTDLEETLPEPPVYGTDGLSDGPDPIDGSGQAGCGPPPPVKQEKPGGQQENGTATEESNNNLSLG